MRTVESSIHIILDGCAAEPLMAYMKALGVLRLVAKHDPSTRGCWRDGVFLLVSSLDHESLLEFFLSQYAPTPIVAPWNGGSGFYPSDNQDGIRAIAESSHPRFHDYRAVIETLRTPGGFLPSRKPEKEEKVRLLLHCRAVLPDAVVEWLDTCYVLTSESPKYPPLLGTGANDGRLEFTNNFMQRLIEMLPVRVGELPTERSRQLLRAALFGSDGVALTRASVGQFHPGGVGGPNGTQGPEGYSLVNPWDYILMIEGALFFAGSVARRLGADTREKAAFPFTVTTSAVGYGTASPGEETSDGSRAEIWLPLWLRAATVGEIAHLFAEGRAQVGQRQARTGVDFARAVAALGVDRGIDAFQRYGFLKRNGLAFLATPLGRLPVTPHPQVRLLDDARLQDWLDRWRSKCRGKAIPARFPAAVRGIDRAIFEYTVRSQSEGADEARALQEILIAFGRLEKLVAQSPRLHTSIRPLQGLEPAWWTECDDGSLEFRLAAALASILYDQSGEIGPFRSHLEPVEWEGGRMKWKEGSPSVVWSAVDLGANLRAVFIRRMTESFQLGLSGISLASSRRVSLADVASFLVGFETYGPSESRWTRLTDLLWGLIGVGPEPAPKAASPDGFGAERSWEEMSIAFSAYSLIKLFAPPVCVTIGKGKWSLGRDKAKSITVKADPRLFRTLDANSYEAVEKACARACNLLKAVGLPSRGLAYRPRRGPVHLEAYTLNPRVLLSSLLFPISPQDTLTLVGRVLRPPAPRA